TSFGNRGKVTTDFGSATESAYGVVLQGDGKIVLVGFVASSTKDFALARYNANGTLDTGFGSGGKVTTDFSSSNDIAYAVVLQSDGKIVVAGSATGPSTADDFALARYNGNGSLDTSFGAGGKVATDFGVNDDYAH